MTQTGLLEHLKLENVSLSQQLTETQHRSIKEKERIALQLQGIEVRAAPSRWWLFVLVFFFFIGLFFGYWSRIRKRHEYIHACKH